MWVYMRHYLNLHILWATLTEFRTVGPYILDWETEQYKCWISQAITFTLLAILQAVNLFWLYLIFRIMKRVLTASVLADDRSDDETDGDEVQGQEKEASPPVAVNGHATGMDRPQVLLNGSPVDEDAAIAHDRAGVKKGKKT